MFILQSSTGPSTGVVALCWGVTGPQARLAYNTKDSEAQPVPGWLKLPAAGNLGVGRILHRPPTAAKSAAKTHTCQAAAACH